MRKNLTARFLKSLKKSSTGQIIIADMARPGLYLRVGVRKMTWTYEKQVFGGTKRKHNLGSYPSVGLAEARETALEIAGEAERGIDRVELAQKAKEEEDRAKVANISTFKILDRYGALKLNSLATGGAVARNLLAALRPVLDLPFADISRAQLQSAIDDHIGNGRIVSANRTRAHLRAFTRWAHQREYLPEDIGFGLQGAGREAPRDRVLSVDEVRSIFEATRRLHPLWGAQFRLLALTGQRRGEIGSLRWTNVDLVAEKITLAGAQTKNRRPHITHLSPRAVEELAVLKAVHDQKTLNQGKVSDLVFTTTGNTPMSGVSKAKKALDQALGDDIEPWRLHDLRRAMATALAGEGIAEGVVDRIQNHAASGSAPSAVARTYQQHDLLPERARALNLWADLVTGTVRPLDQIREGADVLNFGGVRR